MMKIGGLQKVSLIDYPGKISAIIFAQGCNFRCPYCHNPELVDPKRYAALIPSKDLLEFLSVRMGKLDAVTITGGEPTIQRDLMALIRQIRNMGYSVKLDTNGSHPEVLADLLKEKIVDFIAMDVKAPPEKYQNIVSAPVNIDDIRRSIRLVLKSKIPHEFRTTIVRSQLALEDIVAIAREIEGAKRYVLQKFQQTKTLSGNYIEEKTYSDKEFVGIARKLEKKIPLIIVR
jgi:pyruvate formate lyase activating enzyme